MVLTPTLKAESSVPFVVLCERVSKWYGPVIGVNQVTLELREGITGLVAECMRPVSAAHAAAEAAYKHVPGLGEERFPVLLAVPVVRAGAAAAVLVLQRGPEREFTSEEVVLATALAADARFVEAFAIAGTADDALAQARRYREAGTSELVLTFVGTQPEADMADLAHAVARA